MDIYKLKFTVLQQEILRFLYRKPRGVFTARALARHLGVSPTAIAKSLPGLENSITVAKDRESHRLAISLDRNNSATFRMKRVENLRLLEESGLSDHLGKSFPGATILVFGSYAFGEDTEDSDIDLAIIGVNKRDLDLRQFEKLLERQISLHFHASFAGIQKNLKASILNGIILQGAVTI